MNATHQAGLLACGICVLLFVTLEWMALGCGITARRQAIGKAGLAIAGTVVLLFLAVAALKFWPSSPLPG